MGPCAARADGKTERFPFLGRSHTAGKGFLQNAAEEQSGGVPPIGKPAYRVGIS